MSKVVNYTIKDETYWLIGMLAAKNKMGKSEFIDVLVQRLGHELYTESDKEVDLKELAKNIEQK